jgi:RHS repeat-associated protein
VASTATTLDYGYDGLGELTSVQQGASALETYAYDLDGNRDGAPAQTFDADGILHASGDATFHYGASGDLLSATVGGTTVTYGSDALGRRVARTQGGVTEQYLYGDPGNPLRLTASRRDGVLTTYLYDDEGALLAFDRGGTRYYVGADQAGTPKVVFKGDGTVVDTRAYEAFGRLRSQSDPSFDLPIGFAGGLADPLTGLVRMGARDYDPASGRFTARDPSFFDGSGGNLYAYAGSDPVGHGDPTGLYCIGGSFYDVVGGGVTYCHNVENGKDSVCAEGGLGAGAGVSVDFNGDVADSGTTVVAEITEKYGPVYGTVGGELTLDCFNAKGYANVSTAVLGLGAGVDTTGAFSVGPSGSSKSDLNGTGERVEETNALAFKTEGKIALKHCWQY